MGTADNLKTLRKRYGLTQSQLADIAGVSKQAVSTWETGAKEPRMSALEKIANRFNLRKSDLIAEGGLDRIHTEQNEVLIRYFSSHSFTNEEAAEIIRFAEFIAHKR